VYRVWGSRLRVKGLELRVKGFEVWGFRVKGLGSRV
jgi:hypothetical protein